MIEEILSDEAIAEVVAEYEGTEIERAAKSWYTEGTKQWVTKWTWDELGSVAKFTWLSFAERRLARDS